VIFFFVLSFAGLAIGLTPFTCCKRAFIGAAVVYVVTGVVVNIINAILTSAIIDSHTNKRKETPHVG
jgi:uncharacterized membrane protein YjjP (DUF1212 family)